MKVRMHLQQRGFTLIGLVASLGVMMLLVCVFLAGSSGARATALQAKCATHLRQIGIAAHFYAEEDSHGRFPDCSGASWPWDLPAAAAKGLVKNGANREIFYCPANATQNNDELWTFTASGDGTSGFRVIGYALAFRAAGRVQATNITEALTPLPYRIGTRQVQPPPGERVLAADATLSVGENETDRARNRYVNIVGGSTLRHRSAHMNGRMPEGGNLVFLDGHTEWRRFERMRVRTEGNPAFWW